MVFCKADKRAYFFLSYLNLTRCFRTVYQVHQYNQVHQDGHLIQLWQCLLRPRLVFLDQGFLEVMRLLFVQFVSCLSVVALSANSTTPASLPKLAV